MTDLKDRELDAQIAELMGCEVAKHSNKLFVRYVCMCGNGEHGDHSDDHLRVSTDLWDVADYSTNIAPAMQVLEKVREGGFVVLMRRVSRWYVEFSPRTVNPDRDFGRAQHDSLPKAICLAALVALSSTTAIEE